MPADSARHPPPPTCPQAHGHRDALRIHVASAQPAKIVRSPAPQTASARHRASVVTSSGDGNDGDACGEPRSCLATALDDQGGSGQFAGAFEHESGQLSLPVRVCFGGRLVQERLEIETFTDSVYTPPAPPVPRLTDAGLFCWTVLLMPSWP